MASSSRLSRVGLSFQSIALAGGVFALTTLSGCWWDRPKSDLPPVQEPQAPHSTVSVFFSKYQGSKAIVESVNRPLPESEKTTPLQYAVGELLEGPTTQEKSNGFFSEIPKGTKLLGVRREGNTMTIDLSKQFNTGGGSNSMTQRFEEVKQTAFAADSDHKITLTVEGKPLETLGGEGLEVPDSLKRQPQ